MSLQVIKVNKTVNELMANLCEKKTHHFSEKPNNCFDMLYCNLEITILPCWSGWLRI